ncbi:hypothetical protein NBRC3293_0254 [Gluconobacter oxydans NBRC 3293]|uniref:Uncharacterized protein n=1 Tax=Gluconobacter oxydans NBRC 3293 TaxID=1315969 RepID=A0A829WFW8_GLUOY|nr:hypothetical protein NBRC3293_0254 [Gluconobacter oxydans NBRC 3293]
MARSPLSAKGNFQTPPFSRNSDAPSCRSIRIGILSIPDFLPVCQRILQASLPDSVEIRVVLV